MERVSIRIAKDDLKVIQDGAKAEGKTVSDYIRDNLLSRAKVEAESRDKEANIFINEVKEIKTNGKIVFTKLSEVEGKIEVTNGRITALENKITAFEERLFKGINETLIGYLQESFKKLRDIIKGKGGDKIG